MRSQEQRWHACLRGLVVDPMPGHASQVLQGLWKTVKSHPDHIKMSAFFSNDFDQPRWQQAALKNAYALLGKQRYVGPSIMLAGWEHGGACLPNGLTPTPTDRRQLLFPTASYPSTQV